MTNDRWPTLNPDRVVDRTTDSHDEAAKAVAASPDGLLHAGLSSSRYSLCEEGGDRSLDGPNTYVRLNVDLPGASEAKHKVTCPDCRAWMRA